MRRFPYREFLELPAGTIFTDATDEKDVTWMAGLYVKHDTLRDAKGKANDFVYTDLTDIESGGGSNERDERIDAMRADSRLSYPLNDETAREGMFDEGTSYLVYERADLEALKAVIEGSLKGR